MRQLRKNSGMFRSNSHDKALNSTENSKLGHDDKDNQV